MCVNREINTTHRHPTLYFTFLIFKFFNYFFWPCHVACGILVSQPGVEPMPPAVEVQSLNHWTAREGPVPFI